MPLLDQLFCLVCSYWYLRSNCRKLPLGSNTEGIDDAMAVAEKAGAVR